MRLCALRDQPGWPPRHRCSATSATRAPPSGSRRSKTSRSRRLGRRRWGCRGEGSMATDVEHDPGSEAFWALTDEQIDVLRSHGQVRQTATGEMLFQQGDPACDFFVVLEGEVELVEPSVGTPRVIGVGTPREIVGELNLLTEE